MSLASGTRMGPYEILSPLGAGGMGEVYRARDTRLGRQVAIKVLPSEFTADRERLRRFEKEARAASALNHPNIVTVHEVGEVDSRSYIVMELVLGKTLRELLAGPLPIRKLMSVAAQVAEGLSKAHDEGIVHRDLKPENLMVTPDGLVKILDFGLAKLMPEEQARGGASATTVSFGTESGRVLGTVGYMSPEQASGKPMDFRSDQFSLGSVLYEMVAGRRAFARATGPETLAAIIREEPPPLCSAAPGTPAPVCWIVERCLAKDPAERYASTRDLARDLVTLRDRLSATSNPEGAMPGPVDRRKRLRRWLAAAGALATIASAAYVAGTRAVKAPVPTFRQLTFQRGTVLTARFSRDGGTIAYGAAWEGKPFQIFTTRAESHESTSIGPQSADLLAISPTGELAVLLDRRFVFGWVNDGTLARLPLAGGAPREVLNAVQEADWMPDGASLVAVRRVGGRHRLEVPIGRVVYETAGWVSHPRVSPDGARVAFLDHPIYGDDRGAVAVVDRQGRKQTLTPEWASAQGLAWSADGREIWFTASEKGVNSSLQAVALSGRRRTVSNAVGRLMLLDVSRQGRVLLSRDETRVGIIGRGPADSGDRELSWFDESACSDLSADGHWLLFTEAGEGGGPGYGTYLRKTDGSPPVRLGEGQATALSPDGKWALAIRYTSPDELWMLPTGPGGAKDVPRGPIARFQWARWLPGGQGLLITANEAGKRLRIYLHDLKSGALRPVTPEGVGYLLPPTPDGRFVVSTDAAGRAMQYPIDGASSPAPIPGLEPGDVPLSWSGDGRFLFVRRRGTPPVRVERLATATGRSEPWWTLAPADRSGLIGMSAVLVSEDGKAYAFSYHRLLSELYLVEGLK